MFVFTLLIIATFSWNLSSAMAATCSDAQTHTLCTEMKSQMTKRCSDGSKETCRWESKECKSSC